MKFAIISDTHDNWINFKKVIDFSHKEKIELILHCGDICRQEIIDKAGKIFKGQIEWVKGNADHDLDLPEKMEIEFGSKKIFFNHHPDIAKKAAETGKYDLVFYGHTHKPWAQKIVGAPTPHYFCLMANPGELAGWRFKPTFAVYDTEKDKLELKIL